MQRKKAWLWLSDDLALDFLNTVLLQDNTLFDTLGEDADVRRWLAEGGLPSVTERPVKAGRLLRAAQQLRQTIQTAVEARKQQRDVEPSGLNRFLEHRLLRSELRKKSDGRLALVEAFATGDEMELLSPIAYAASQLLVQADFDLIRQCEGSACVLWFHDVTKAHRRRWCNMATCGNRHKVELFRTRERRNTALPGSRKNQVKG